MVMRNIVLVHQNSPDTCWAACAQMWATDEGMAYWSQEMWVDYATNEALVYSGGNAGGVLQDSLDSLLFGCINLLNDVGSRQPITTVHAASANDVPDIANVIANIGTVYAAFTWPGSTGGHANVIYGTDGYGNIYSADPASGLISRPLSFWYSSLPSFFAWKTPYVPGSL